MLGHVLAEVSVGEGEIHGKIIHVPFVMWMGISKPGIEPKEGHAKPVEIIVRGSSQF